MIRRGFGECPWPGEERSSARTYSPESPFPVSCLILRGEREMAEKADPASEWQKKWSELVAKAWTDPALKQRLLADPQAVLAEQGMPVPAGAKVIVHESSAEAIHLVLSPRPGPAEISDADLQEVAAAGSCGEGPDRQPVFCIQ